jgi:PHD-finger
MPLTNCHAYYLGSYKSTCEYYLLKAVCIDERGNKAAVAWHDFDVCAICGDGGSLIICDGCEGEYHMSCLRPALRTVPEGRWLCDECVDRQILAARDRFIRRSKFFENGGVDDVSMKKRSLDRMLHETEDDKSSSVIVESKSISGSAVYQASPSFIDAARTFAQRIQAILSKPGE